MQLLDPDRGEFPEPGYRTIGPVTARVPEPAERDVLVRALRTEAARLGADAVILQRIRQEGEPGRAVLIVEGLAIYWVNPR